MFPYGVAPSAHALCLLTQRVERSPAGVLGELPVQQGAQCSHSREADHHVAHKVDAQGTGHIRLRGKGESTGFDSLCLAIGPTVVPVRRCRAEVARVLRLRVGGGLLGPEWTGIRGKPFPTHSLPQVWYTRYLTELRRTRTGIIASYQA